MGSSFVMELFTLLIVSSSSRSSKSPLTKLSWSTDDVSIVSLIASVKKLLRLRESTDCDTIQNKVVGYPIFIIEYYNNMRNGHHRTTPLLSQSIVEEGPHIIAHRDTFRKMTSSDDSTGLTPSTPFRFPPSPGRQYFGESSSF